MANVAPPLSAGKLVILGSFLKEVMALFSSTVVGWLGLLFRNWLVAALLMSARTSSGIGLFCRVNSRLPRKSM